jgi:hypothetical protein
MQELIYNGQAIHTKDADMLSLTDMWRAADCPIGKEPWRWVATDAASQFIDYIAENLNLARSEVWKAGRGKGGQTFAHWQIGFAYAKYVSHEFHAWCNDVVRQHMEVLAKRGEARQQGKVSRKVWAAACFSKGCDQRGIADATNATYQTFFGKTAKQLREANNLKKSASLRDHMRLSSLAAVSLTEALAAEHISDMLQQGNQACIGVTASCATKVKGAVVAAQRERQMIEIRE